uniref:G-protein coupled receptors family 1 profile domain-containing protein n=1 Tax=Plectus sambesii TaxID=2011161 RepID=A0A914XPN2_9BILA
MLTQAQQAQASVRKRRVMYVLILMVVAFVGSWLPLTIVNLLRDFNLNIAFLNKQMYFSLLNVHAIAMTSIVWNPMLYFWMSKRHRRALKHDMFWFTNARRSNGLDTGMLQRCAPSPSVTIVYKRSLASSNSNNNNNKIYNGHNSSGKSNRPQNSAAHYCRRGTLADPTFLRQEQAINQIHASCFLLVPLMPAVNAPTKNGYKPSALMKNKKAGYLPMGLKKNTAAGSIQKLLRPG